MKTILVYFLRRVFFLGKLCWCWIHVCALAWCMFPVIAAPFDLISIGDAMHSVCDDANEMTADGRNSIPPPAAFSCLLVYLFMLPALNGFHFYNWLKLNWIALSRVLDKLSKWLFRRNAEINLPRDIKSPDPQSFPGESECGGRGACKHNSPRTFPWKCHIMDLGPVLNLQDAIRKWAAWIIFQPMAWTSARTPLRKKKN